MSAPTPPAHPAAPAPDHGHHGSFWTLTLGALGVVFGDIGTSPLYTLKECALHAKMHTGNVLDREDLFGILSLIFWAMTLVITFKYLVFVMRADNNGEGGIFALLALMPRKMRSTERGQVQRLALLAILGASLLYGDGMITPAISVLGAVEGIGGINPALKAWVVPIACVILVGLFALQSRGTATVGKLFGPVMLLWFATIGLLGIYHISHDPHILTAVLPTHAFNYFMHHGWGGFTILASVVLAVTGGEALYADMGHFGLKPIRAGWLGLAFPALLLNYFGQGALVDRNLAAAENPFYSMVPAGGATLALVILASAAAVIASQALISGAFSLTRQAMQLGFFPRVRVRHTAHDVEGQVYLPEINMLLAVGCLALVVGFRTSSNLAAAYGIAVTGDMVITSFMFYVITREAWGWSIAKSLPLVAFFLLLDLPFLAANLTKFFVGGYVPVLIAAVFLVVMVVWNRGRTLIGERYAKRFPSPEWAKEEIESHLSARVPGTAVFMASNDKTIPPILVSYVTRSRSLHETVILVTVQFANSPTVPAANRLVVSRDACEFWRVVMVYGFMEEPEVVDMLTQACAAHNIPFDPEEVVYFLGRESFVASKRGHMGPVEENLFAFLSRNTVAADRFFGLPHRQVMEIGTQMDL
ncbi:MAG: KUP/HAK/KT family potassium transporter [Bryobacterales bacterium]|nr:KUP/HAK/KT family potassium transporter [Bryobacterales bacterium]